MKRIILLLMVLIPVAVSAQSFRDKGYKGSVSYTDICLHGLGIETSHGYMLDSHNYLGAGAGVYVGILRNDSALYASIFIDYTAYWLNRPSTPFSSVKIGWVIEPAWQTVSDPFIEPTIGWSWAVGKVGLDLGIGCKIMPILAVPQTFWNCHPTISFSLNF